MLSSHPLPIDALAGPALRRIFADTPPAPRTRAVATRARVERGSDPALVADRYQVESYLESGGTADVYAATDLATGRPCAVKLLRRETAENPLLRAHFLLGARAAMRIRHPHVVRVMDVGEPRHGLPYAAMELLSGKPLDVLVRGERALPPLFALEIVTQIGRGLACAHERGVVHCDVKPENLFAARTEARALLIKVLDFDLACVDGSQDPGEDHVLRGTAKYMAPEQVVGDPVDARTDVYALGVTLFRLLTGHLPFDMELSVTLLRHQLRSPVPPVTWLVEGLDRRFETLVARATRKRPENRYPDMNAFVTDLEAVASDLPLAEVALASSDDSYRPSSARGRDNAAALGAG